MDKDLYNSGLKALYEINPEKAFEYFNTSGNIFGCGYCKFITGELEEAKIILTLIQGSSSAVNWILSLIDIIREENKHQPTYFQIRNFYEQDLEMLFLYKQNVIIEKIINKNKYLENFNKEVYKYTARVLLNNNYIKEAETFIKKSLSFWYNDPESHFILGEIYLANQEKENAKKAFLKAIEVNKEYYPSNIKLKDLS